ncbi:hypothetical protein DFQ01_107105 [Paenibacillus cellulosilyticus]|uniref:Butirosin biosynthesis protein H N-terminal domain-containing protein n=1 Tax=Paenibacillus cellulosilyticus TaxID=375489 RepID=A0A2V2YUE0_9BACL|nr:hypothetical protein [Paenibacillus cellulosilyticus]PWW03208.1 hypothetical protein DFQ01_107105 [Paenibacillus cellulosilyticus]QKS43698.1 hypothetical protein HUB94_04055 [Paenibacillus cellulosilyticus]
MKRKLSIEANPGFALECYHNFRLSVVLSVKSNIYWLHSHFINLMVTQVDSDFPTLRFEDHLDVYSNVIEEELHVDTGDIIPFIKCQLNKGHYVLLYLDWALIPDSHFYNKKPMIHECLVYGYNDETNKLSILAFEVSNTTFGSIEVDYHTCTHAFHQVLKRENYAQKWFAFYGFPLSVIKGLQNHDTRLNRQKIFFALEKGMACSSHVKSGYSLGYGVPHILSSFFKERINENTIDPFYFPYWNIINQKLLLHNNIALTRLQLIEHEDGHSTMLQKILSIFQEIRSMLKSNKLNSINFQKKPETALCIEISNGLRKIGEKERRANTMLLEYFVSQHIGKYIPQ